ERTAGDSAGDFVVQLDQPYRDLAVNLLEAQHYPEKAQYPPYDDIAWTLGDLYGVAVHAVTDSGALHWTGLRALTDTVAASQQVRGAGTVYLLPYPAQTEVIAALYALRGAAAGHSLPLVAVTQPPDVVKRAITLPRVAIYRAWYDTQDEGWARYTFEQY